MTFKLSNKTRLQWAGSLLPAVVAVCASAAPAGAPAPSAAAAEYSIINLGSETGLALLNQRGQAAVSDWSPGASFNGFFDGTRIHTLGTLGGSFTIVTGLNNNGVVVGQSEGSVPRGNFDDYAFTWTAARGMRALPGPTWAQANAINDNNQAAGFVWKGGFYSAANRWNPDGTLTSLGPNLGSKAAGVAINNSGVTVGYADVQRYDDRAMVWDANGKPTDLGRFGGSTSYADFVNAGGQVGGHFYRDDKRYGFFWSPHSGSVEIGPGKGANLNLAALNDNGELAGNTEKAGSDSAGQYLPFIWSLQRGSRALPLAGATHGEVLALNNRSAMVGSLGRTRGNAASGRAVFWSGVSNPVDLNKRLYRAPAGLVLYAARAINDNGAILADSNAGLVLLRPGREGTAAPVLGPIAGAADTVALGGTIDFTAGFADSAATEKHTASASVNDACTQAAPRLTESQGAGSVSLRHTFCRAGVFKVKVKVTDRAGNATEVRRTLTVIDPAAATLVGNGALAQAGPVAPRHGQAPLHFSLWAPLDAGNSTAASGMVHVSGPFQFRSEAVTQRQQQGQLVQLKGDGRFNGQAGYRFAVEATPDQTGNAGRLRLRISHTDAATGAEVVDYDNGAHAVPAAARMLGGPDGTAVTQGKLQLAARPAAR